MLCSALAVSASAASQYNPETLDEDNYDITQSVLEDDNFTLGDVNASGGLDAIDSLCLKATIVGTEGYICNTEAADIDADGKLTAKDSYYMRSCIAGNSLFQILKTAISFTTSP